MKKEVKIVNEEKGLVQITTADERWYGKPIDKKVNGVPVIEYQWLPSITWITGCIPKGPFYEDWLRENGENSKELLRKAGERGTRVHNAIEQLLNGNTVRMDSRYDSEQQFIQEEDYGSTLNYTEMNGEEWYAVLTWIAWWEEKIKDKEINIVGIERSTFYYNADSGIGFGATIDLEVYIDGKYHCFDWKTSKSVYSSHVAQICGIAASVLIELGLKEVPYAAIVQVGYTRNKRGYKETEVEPDFNKFKFAYSCWKHLVPKAKPTQRDLPIEASIRTN